MLITFSGLDGAGKSSLIAWLKDELERRGRAVTVLHMNRDVGLYSVLRVLRDTLTGAPRDATARAIALEEVVRRPGLVGRLQRLRDALVWSRSLRRLIYPIDLLVFLCCRLYVEALRKRILIMDRYFYDTLVDVARPGGWGWLRWLHRITPTPDVPVLLEISPEAAYARKGEYSLGYLRARETAYGAVFRWVERPLVLQASDLVTSKRALMRVVLGEPAHSSTARAAHRPTPPAQAATDQDAELRHAAWLLRLLLDRRTSPDGHDVDWDMLLEIARRNGVLARTAERLLVRDVALPEPFAEAVAHEQGRIGAMLELIHQVSRTCEAAGLEFVFPKAFQDYPDMGDDVDLLLLERSTRVDRRILAELDAATLGRDLGGRIAGTTTYAVSGCPSPLDVQHGRLGVVGEHRTFPRALLQHRGRRLLDGTEVTEPPVADQLVLQGLQRVWGRRQILLCDVVFTISAIRRGTLDWEYVIGTARQHGGFQGLCCYLSYVDQIHRDVFGRPLLAAAVRQRLVLRGWGRTWFRAGAYRFAVLRVNTRLYLQQLVARLAAGDWEGAGRICLLPLVALARAARRLAPRRPPPPPPAAGVGARPLLVEALDRR